MTAHPEDQAPASDGSISRHGLNPARRLDLISRSVPRLELLQLVGRVEGLTTIQLLEVLRADQLRRWRSGEPISVRSYLESFPGLCADSEIALDLIWSEFLIREALGDHPDLETYASDFPQYESPLRRQHEVHQWVERAEVPVSSCGTPGVPSSQVPTADASPRPGWAQGREASHAGACPFRLPGFEVLDEIGRGGMGVVYKAKQLSLGRVVALKVLPPAYAAEPERRRRFRTEAEVAARLSDSRILPVFDILESQGTFVLVMPYIDGWDLARLLEDRRAVQKGESQGGRHPCGLLGGLDYLRFVLPVLDQVVAAVAAVHAAGVLHRDLKPSNILVDRRGEVRLSDFGLARLGPESLITAQGQRLGTPGFMAPEQWAGDGDIDTRADVFGLGVTLYQALTLEMPYGRDRIDTTVRPPSRPSKGCPWLPAEFDAFILRALEPDRRDRHASAVELQEEWGRIRDGLHAKNRHPSRARRLARWLRRHPRRALQTTVFAFALGLPGIAWMRSTGPTTGPSDAVAVLRTVELITKPPGARAIFIPIDEDDGRPDPDHAVRTAPGEATPARFSLAPGAYLVEVEIGGRGFHEVYRQVPRPGQRSGAYRHCRWVEQPDGVVELAEIEIPEESVTSGMAYFPGREDFLVGSDKVQRGPFRTPVPAFYLDTTEVTVDRYRKVALEVPPPLIDLAPRDDEAVRFVTFDEAMHYAEKLGKRLPDEVEYEYAATGGGTREFPWGDSPRPLQDHPWSFGPVGQPTFDRTATSPPVSGLFSNIAEWTTSWINSPPGGPHPHGRSGEEKLPFRALLPVHYRSLRVVRGGPFSVVKGDPDLTEVLLGPRARHAMARIPIPPAPYLGFRCARAARPRFL